MNTDPVQTPVQIEGNVSEIDLAAQFLILEDRQAKPFIKIFWPKVLEGPEDSPSYTFKKIRKLQPGFFAAPIVMLEESTGGMQEAVLIDLPWKDRPADFPKPQKKGGKQYAPRNEKAIILRCCLKVAADVWNAPFDKVALVSNEDMPKSKEKGRIVYEEIMTKITAEAIRASKELCREAGVQ